MVGLGLIGATPGGAEQVARTPVGNYTAILDVDGTTYRAPLALLMIGASSSKTDRLRQGAGSCTLHFERPARWPTWRWPTWRWPAWRWPG